MAGWTLAASVLAAAAAIFTAVRASMSWSADYTAKRFETALERALSANEVEQNLGRQQLLGMSRRRELRRKDEHYVEDTIQALVGAPPPNITNPEQVVVVSPGAAYGDDAAEDPEGA